MTCDSMNASDLLSPGDPGESHLPPTVCQNSRRCYRHGDLTSFEIRLLKAGFLSNALHFLDSDTLDGDTTSSLAT